MPSSNSGHAGRFGRPQAHHTAPGGNSRARAATISDSLSISANVRAVPPSAVKMAVSAVFRARTSRSARANRVFSPCFQLPSGIVCGSIFDMKLTSIPTTPETVIVCACGATYRTRSTRDNLKNRNCAACHPFFHWRAEVRRYPPAASRNSRVVTAARRRPARPASPLNSISPPKKR